MEEPRYLIDTNAVIDFLGQKLSDSAMEFMSNVVDAVPNISIISKIEVLGFNAPKSHYNLLSSFMNDANIIELTTEIAETCIDIRKQYKIKLPDAIIAASALSMNLSLITRNTKDFNIRELELVNPWNL